MSIDKIFANLARGFSAQYGSPLHAAVMAWAGEPVMDDGGSILTPGVPTQLKCTAQIGAATTAMRADAGYRENDASIIILAQGPCPAGFAMTDAKLQFMAGPYKGQMWSIESSGKDPAMIGWLCRGREVRNAA